MFSLNPSLIKTQPNNFKTYFSNDTHKFVTIPKTEYKSVSTPTPVSISLKPNNNNEYLVLIDDVHVIEEIDTDSEPYSDNDNNGKGDDFSDYIPQIYFGSLTILGLYIFYKLLNKR